ncbi:MAG: hypothetical protein A2Y66_05175 [Nitrospirae bacterium RBG_13_41_22]|nr:MAG: hypothetical protein A2Y66_05175 [Nitrospirae bacterium RBG_13_41_22]
MTVPEEVPSDEYLAKEALSGKDETFTELIRRHKQVVLNIIARHIRNHYELDDLCQEIFIMVYQNLRRYHCDEPFEHWVSMIAFNTCNNVFRKQRCKCTDVPPDHGPFALSDPAFEELPDDEA